MDKIQELSFFLSTKFDCVAFAVLVHDDDVLYWVCFKGDQVIEGYNSSPSYFEFGQNVKPKPPSGGDVTKLAIAFPLIDQDALARVLHKNKYSLETQRHAEIVEVIKVPSVSVGVALSTLERGVEIDGMPLGAVMWSADPPPIEDPKVRRRREFYESLGPEDSAKTCRREGCTRGTVKFSVYCRPHHYEKVKGKPSPFDH
jgi:hypothetical protein